MRNCPIFKEVESSKLLLFVFQTFHVDPLTVYSPVREEKTAANPEPFLTKNPIEYVQNGEFTNVPWILGIVKDEGLLKVEGKIDQNPII